MGVPLEQVARFLERLSNANVTQQLEDCALWIGHERAIRFTLEVRNAEERIRLFVEQAETVVATRETFGEPRRQWARCPPVELQFQAAERRCAERHASRALTLPPTCRPLRRRSRSRRLGCSSSGVSGSGEYTTRETREPARAHVVDGEVGGDAHGRQLLRRDRAAGANFTVEVV